MDTRQLFELTQASRQPVGEITWRRPATLLAALMGAVMSSPLWAAVLAGSLGPLYLLASALHLIHLPGWSSAVYGWSANGRLAFGIFLIILAIPILTLMIVVIAVGALWIYVSVSFGTLGAWQSLTRRPLESADEAAGLALLDQSAIAKYAADRGYAQPDWKGPLDGILAANIVEPGDESLLFSGKAAGYAFSWFGLGDQKDLIRVSAPKTVPGIVVTSKLWAKEKDVAAVLAKLRPLRLEGDFGTFYDVYVEAGGEDAALEILTPDVMLTMLSELGWADMEFRGDHIDFVFSALRRPDIMDIRLQRLAPVLREVFQQLIRDNAQAAAAGSRRLTSRFEKFRSRLADRVGQFFLIVALSIGIFMLLSQFGTAAAAVGAILFLGTSAAGLLGLAVVVYLYLWSGLLWLAKFPGRARSAHLRNQLVRQYQQLFPGR